MEVAMFCPNEHQSFWHEAIRTSCLTAAALLVWFAGRGDVCAGVIVNCEPTIGGEMAASQWTANPPSSIPIARDWKLVLQHLGAANNSGGAGPQSPTYGPSMVSAALINARCAMTQAILISRFTLSRRISLPSLFKDRFFRPPRLAMELRSIVH